MARIEQNPFGRGVSGKFGEHFVYRNRGTKTHMVQKPRRKKRLPTEEEEERRDNFALAAVYAKGALTNPELKELYGELATDDASAYNMAFKDYMKPPKIKRIDASAYNGTVGAVITTVAKDDFRVMSAKVTVRTAAGELVEEGDASINPLNFTKWDYTAKQNNPALAGSIITVVVKDYPGNATTMQLTL